LILDDGAAVEADACSPLEQAVAQGQAQLHALARDQYPGRPLPNDELAGLKSVGFWNVPEPAGWGLPWHCNEGIELTYLDHGRHHFETEHFADELTPGQLTITRPWQPHRVGNPGLQPGCLYWLILDVGVRRPNQRWQWPGWINLVDEDLQRLTAFLRHNEDPVWTAPNALGACFREIGQIVRGQRQTLSHLVVSINLLLIYVLEMLEAGEPRLDENLSSTERTVELFLEQVKDSPALLAKPWSIEQLAAACGLGVTRFSQLCRRLVNATPVEYLNRCRLDYASLLLQQHPDRPIQQIAAEVGFRSGRYFATQFRHRFGCTPTDWRGQT
jgi:AraC family L-rhamnose operon regulatory protein RhaS